jgi:hypothetical protein
VQHKNSVQVEISILKRKVGLPDGILGTVGLREGVVGPAEHEGVAVVDLVNQFRPKFMRKKNKLFGEINFDKYDFWELFGVTKLKISVHNCLMHICLHFFRRHFVNGKTLSRELRELVNRHQGSML